MSSFDNLQLFLVKYLRTRNISWLELFISEYCKHKKHNSAKLQSIVEENDKFIAVSFHMSYHLLKMLFSTICEMMTMSDAGADSKYLRNFLTSGLGSQIITMLGDLDLSNVTNERELVNVLMKTFPTECWEEASMEKAHLDRISRKDVKELYKGLWLLDPLDTSELLKEETDHKIINIDAIENVDDTEDYEKFLQDLNKSPELHLTSSQLAYKIIKILQKLVLIENATVMGQTDQDSVTMCCLRFSLDSMSHLNEQMIFNSDDQTVIKLNLMELTFLCFNNLVNRDGKSIQPVFKQLLKVLVSCIQPEISCGLSLNIVSIVGNFCVKNSIQKTENLNMFVLCKHVILEKMKDISEDRELLHIIQRRLIKVINNIRLAHQIRFCDKKKPKKNSVDWLHHDSLSDACSFEKLLIESFPLIKSFKKMQQILNYLRAKGVCCCNGKVDTIKIFMRPSLVPTQVLSFVKGKIMKPSFDRRKVCVHCKDKFNGQYFELIRSEISRRQGWELHALLHHLTALQKVFSPDVLRGFVSHVIVPTFEIEKAKFLADPEKNFESKLIVATCLTIISESAKETSQLFTSQMIQHFKDCSLVPMMAANACQLLKLVVSDVKLPEHLRKSANGILFSNVLFLIRELMEIYEQIDLPKDVPLTDSQTGTLHKSTDDFEVLDEKIVAVKEALSDLDVLLLNTIHWNILSDLIANDPTFKRDFVANIYNNFSGNILFTIAYNALNSILLKKELKPFHVKIESKQDDSPVMFERCAFLTPALVPRDDINYDVVIERFHHFYEITRRLSERLNSERPFIYRLRSDNDTKFHALVHKNIFLPDNANESSSNEQRIAVDQSHWLNQVLGIFEGKAIRDRFIKVIQRLARTEDEIKAIHRETVIKDITGRCGVKYLSSIARNCFDICWRLSDNISFSAKMATALEELKLLLLQDNWDDHQEAMVDALQLLLGVAEMKTRRVSRMMFMDPENHLRGSTESMFSDFNSSLERITFDEKSDDEDSSEMKTETFYTADENYDADEECFSTNGETECSQSFRSCALPAMLGFRNTNEHICKLVVEILMDLSKRCIERPEQWQANILISLAQRLICMKTYLGGSEFLLRGFAAILQSQDENFISLQKTILELVEDLNTPGSLQAFLSLLTVDGAAIEPVISRFETLCKNEEYPKPFVKVSFPTFSSEANITSTCDTNHHRLVQSFREVHLSNKLLTPFTESSQIIPLNFMEFKPWNNNGFSVATWLEVEAAENENFSAHLISLGSEKLMLAIYINADGSFCLNVLKPNQNFSDSKLSKIHGTANKENVNKTNIFGIALATLKDSDAPNIRTRGFLQNGFKKVEQETAKRLQTSKISMTSKRVKVKPNEWTHVCFSARSSDSEIMLLITVNGAEQELIEIPIDGMRDSDANGMLQLICIGAQRTETASLKYSIANVALFSSPLESPSHLFSLGPDCDCLIDCEAVEAKALLGMLDINKIGNKMLAKIDRTKLKNNVLAIYSAGKMIGYKTSDHGKPLEMFTVGKIPKPLAVPSLARSIQLSGGLSTLLFLFARTVEMTDDPTTQSSALFIFLKMSYSNNQLYAEFEQKNLFNLIAHVFKHSNCYRGPGMLKAILDVTYGGTMFNRRARSDDYQINEQSDLNLQNPELLLKLLENFNIFQSANILDLLFKSLMVVVRETHPHKHLNRQRLVDHDFYKKLIEFCKIHLANSANTIAITPTTALVIVQLLKMLSKYPPLMWSMNEIPKLLLLMHHPSESFVTHDRTKFNFILPGSKPQKQSKLNLSAGSKYFNFKVKIRSSPKPPSSPPRSPDSVSMLHELPSSSRGSRNAVNVTPSRKMKTKKFDELTGTQTQKIAKVMSDSKTRKEMKTPTKAHVRRLQPTPKRLKLKNTPKREEAQASQEDQQLADRFQTLMSAGSMNAVLTEVDVNRYETGVSVLQENLFMMLRDAVTLLDDTRAEKELPECLKIEMLIMFANHHEPNVRSAIIELVNVLTSRQTAEVVARYEKANFWVHLGNQLAISRVNLRMAQAVVDWICVDKVVLQDLSRAQKIQIKYKPAFGILFALLPSMVHDAQLLNCTIKFVRLILETLPDCFGSIMLNGLIIAGIKALMKLDRNQERAKEAILTMLEQIASKALTSTGSIQSLWDLLYGLAFVERSKKHEMVREVHVAILKQLIGLCLAEQNRRSSRGGESLVLVVVQLLGTLPQSEIKTRFNMIHDRAVQFVTSWEADKELMASEAEFIKYLVQLYFSGVAQGSSALLLWGLNPAGAIDVKLFIVRKLTATLVNDPNFAFPGNDTKLIKSLLLKFLSEITVDDTTTQTIAKFCGVSVNQQQQSWNWSMSAVEKIEVLHQTSQKDQNAAVDKVVYKLEPLVQICIDGAMKMTRNVIDVQNHERRYLMNELKKSQEIDFYREWFELIQRMVHEDAPWYNKDLYPSTWELDETEGPGRVRIRLKRCVLHIEERFFASEFQHKASFQHRKPLLDFLLRPKETEKYSISDRVVYTFNAKHLTMEQEIEGEVIITDHQLVFLANRDTYINSIICDVKSVSEIWNRRYQHKEVALEIFLVTRKTFFIIFETNYERDIVWNLVSNKLGGSGNSKLEEMLLRWLDNRLTNFEYLTELNKIAGRSYNDLMQYPVFPWILTDYESSVLDLRVPKTFRKLNKTISTQHEEMEEHYVTNFKYLAQSMAEQQTVMKPYHYSSHYSNSGTILHFLVRLPPFTNMFLLYQDHNFDIPDRTFHSMATTFKLTSKESATDVKELIPEFFYLFDFFENCEGFNFGKRQSGDLVNDVKLPDWCEGSARLFMLIHRQALECDFVRRQLNQWIDLIFGYKQKGKAAVDAVNVFHPATYPEFQITNITDQVERSAYETMIRTYGQMPKQIFTSAHRKTSSSNDNQLESRVVLKSVIGLRWGIFTGSPQLSKPKLIERIKCTSRTSRLLLSDDTNMFYGLPEKCHLMRLPNSLNHDLVLWSESDGVVRVKSLKDVSQATRKLFHIPSSDPVTACGAHLKHSNLWFGHQSGNISVYVRTDSKLAARPSQKKSQTYDDVVESIIGIETISPNSAEDDEPTIKSTWNFPVVLVKHRGEILDLKVCVEFKIVVSIGSDGRTVIWDSQKIEYIRTIEASCNTLKSQLTLVEVSPTLGDILTVFSPRNGDDITVDEESFEVTDGEDFINVSMAITDKSQLRLHTINAKYIKHTFADGFVTAACFSFIKEGTGVNVIAVGFDDGGIKFYSTWTLKMIREIATGMTCPISEIIFTTHHHLTFLADQEIHVWESDGLTGERPKFHSIALC